MTPNQAPSAFGDVNWLYRGATITADRELTSLPASRLEVPRVSKRYRAAALSDGDTRTIVQIDFGAVRAIRRIAWQRVREPADIEDVTPGSFIASDIVQHKLSTTDAHDGDVYDSGDITSDIVNGYGMHDHLVPLDAGAVRQARFAEFQFDALSRTIEPFNFVDWGTAYYVDQLELALGMSAPFDYLWTDASTVSRSFDGSGEIINPSASSWRELAIPFRAIAFSERTKILDYLARTGKRNRFLFIEDASTNNPRGTMIARNVTPNLSRTSRARNRMNLQLVESL